MPQSLQVTEAAAAGVYDEYDTAGEQKGYGGSSQRMLWHKT
jgi:hypothetical protein